MKAEKIEFSFNTPYTAKGESVVGENIVQYKDGGILWNENIYSELTFLPTDAFHKSHFTLSNVPIGINFHWQREQTQMFCGSLTFIVYEKKLYAINHVPAEIYLESVISSEMSSNAPMDFLKAHAVVSRSWLLKQMEHCETTSENSQNSFFSIQRKENEYIRWYDRREHTLFDVCADDHCQRYQGIPITRYDVIQQAIAETRGEVLTHHSQICDARFSKCCGGVTEQFSTCWEDENKPYLQSVIDSSETNKAVIDLRKHADADVFIRSTPNAFCSTNDPLLLRQVLNDYDQDTSDFFRWKICYSQEQLSQIIAKKTEVDFGNILDLIPLERGVSGRISMLEIVGSKKSLVIGKELEIRRVLSETHLYSSAFIVEKSHFYQNIPQTFTFIGAGWGHGVGLCQIGAATMASKGYTYKQILSHYYKNSKITRYYE